MAKKRTRLEVTWLDSVQADAGWLDVDDAIERRVKDTICTSVGYVLADDKVGLILAGSLHAGQAAGVMYIPKGAIRRRRKLHG